jgi:hypothetical protein
MTVPEEAIAAAAGALHEADCNDGDAQTCGRWRCGSDPASRFHSLHVRHVGYYRERAATVLDAAAPLILREAAKPQFEQAIRDLADLEFRKRAPEMLATVNDAVGAALYPRVGELVEAAKAAERERIIQLASAMRASIPADHPEGALASFADYLRVTSADEQERAR